MTITSAQKANLIRLADYLDNLEPTYQGFNMLGYGNTAAKCGTTACAAGHTFAAGIADRGFFRGKYGRTDWPHVVKTLYTGGDLDVFRWLFGISWGWKDIVTEGVDNTPWGAAARIRYFVTHGLPSDWKDQLTGTSLYMFAGIRDLWDQSQ